MTAIGNAPMKHADTILFLGAGASDFAGYQTFRRFGDLLLDEGLRYRENLPGIATETPRLILEMQSALERMQRPATHDNYLWLLTDYHNFCEKFDTHTGLQSRFPRITDDIRSFDSLSTIVINDLTRTTFCHYSRERHTGVAGEEVRSLYEHLATRNNPSDPFLPIYSTNYDLLLEDLFADSRRTPSRIQFFNGIPGRTRRGARWSPKAYETAGVHLYRLHGCISWFHDNLENPGSSVSFVRPESIDGDLLNRLCVMFPGRELERGRNPHGYGFRLLFSSLLRCKVALFIGFSFRDDDVMQVLLAANALREHPLRIFMVDPRIGPSDVLANLDGAAKRSAFQVRLPRDGDLHWLRQNYGQPGVKQAVLEFLDGA